MKKLLSQLFFLLFFLNVNSQDFGFTQISISSLSSTNININININVKGLSNCGTYLSHEILSTGTTITLNICYYFCGLGIVVNNENDFQISIPNPDLYTINITAYESNSGNSICNFNNIQDTATINFNMPLNETITLSTNQLNLISRSNFYPNPTTGILNINNFECTIIDLFDLFGKKIKTFNINNKKFIDVSDLSNGVYFIKTNDSRFNKIEKIVVQK